MKAEDIKSKTIRARVTEKELTDMQSYARKKKWALADVIRDAIKRLIQDQRGM